MKNSVRAGAKMYRTHGGSSTACSPYFICAVRGPLPAARHVRSAVCCLLSAVLRESDLFLLSCERFVLWGGCGPRSAVRCLLIASGGLQSVVCCLLSVVCASCPLVFSLPFHCCPMRSSFFHARPQPVYCLIRHSGLLLIGIGYCPRRF